jgi:hypothetical protein
LDSEVGAETRRQLITMENDPLYSTAASYTPNTAVYPDNVMSFADKHMDYLSTHLGVGVPTYLANLRLKTRSRVAGIIR